MGSGHPSAAVRGASAVDGAIVSWCCMLQFSLRRILSSFLPPSPPSSPSLPVPPGPAPSFLPRFNLPLPSFSHNKDQRRVLSIAKAQSPGEPSSCHTQAACTFSAAFRLSASARFPSAPTFRALLFGARCFGPRLRRQDCGLIDSTPDRIICSTFTSSRAFCFALCCG